MSSVESSGHEVQVQKITGRALKSIEKGERSFEVKGGWLGMLATSHAPEVYADVAAELMEQHGIGIQAHRVSKIKRLINDRPVRKHIADIITVTSLAGTPIEVEPHATYLRAQQSPNYIRGPLYPRNSGPTVLRAVDIIAPR